MFKKWLKFQMDVCTIIEMNPYDLSYIVIEERRRVLKECHNDAGGAHQGIVRTQSKIKALYYWMSITSDVEAWVKYMFIICFLLGYLFIFLIMGIKHSVTSAYHPQRNGQDERSNQT